jgi:hypothetical protein
MQDRLSSPLELKFSGTETSGTIAGYASTFGGAPDAYGDLIAPSAFAKSLAEHAAAGTQPAMLWAHNPDQPIGVWTSLAEDRHGLKVAGKLTLQTQKGAEAHALAKDGALGLSIGYRAVNSTFSGGHRVLTEIKLFEASLVAMPANPAARVTSIKSALDTPDNIREFEALLRDALGFSVREAKRLASGGWRALEHRDDASGELQQVAALFKAAAQTFTHPRK